MLCFAFASSVQDWVEVRHVVHEGRLLHPWWFVYYFFPFLIDSRGAVIDEFVHCPTKTANYLRRCDRTYMFDCECALVCFLWWYSSTCLAAQTATCVFSVFPESLRHIAKCFRICSSIILSLNPIGSLPARYTIVHLRITLHRCAACAALVWTPVVVGRWCRLF